jgi:hypothetical protein
MLTLGTFRGEGQLKLSQDGRFLTLLGYNSVSNSTTAVHRAANSTVGRIDVTGTANYFTYAPSNATNSLRSAVSIDGTTAFTKSSNTSNTALNVSLATPGPVSPTPVATFGNTSIRTLEVFNNILFTASSGTAFAFSSTVASNSVSSVTSTPLTLLMTNGVTTYADLYF